MTKQLVSRRVMALEACLGVQMLVRTTCRVGSTERGQDYVETARVAVM